MALDIRIYITLDEIRDRHGFSKKDWAEASKLPQPRISELAKLAKLHRSGKENEAAKKTGRLFTLEKCRALVDGLAKLIGGDMLRRELMQRIEQAKDDEEQNMIILMALGPGQQRQANLYLKTLIQVNENNTHKKQ